MHINNGICLSLFVTISIITLTKSEKCLHAPMLSNYGALIVIECFSASPFTITEKGELRPYNSSFCVEAYPKGVSTSSEWLDLNNYAIDLYYCALMESVRDLRGR